LAGFLCFFGLAAAPLWAETGLMLIGLPAGASVVSLVWGSGRKNTWQPGEELGLVPDHADGDAVDVGNFGAAQLKRVAAAGLLLLGG
jgi:hypothetical protein